MPMHDWKLVDAGIYHDFHHEWISEIKRALNAGLLPADHYALAEQHAAGFGPDVLTLQEGGGSGSAAGTAVAPLAKPKTTFYAQTPGAFYRQKQNSISVRHVSGDRVVAMIEIVSPGNKNNQRAFQAFVDKARELLSFHVHLLIIDPIPPGRRDPNGIHAEIWSAVEDDSFLLPPERPLTLAAYRSGNMTEAFVETVGVGDPLPDMPLFLSPELHVMVPLEATYQSAWATVPARWRKVVAGE